MSPCAIDLLICVARGDTRAARLHANVLFWHGSYARALRRWSARPTPLLPAELRFEGTSKPSHLGGDRGRQPPLERSGGQGLLF